MCELHWTIHKSVRVQFLFEITTQINIYFELQMKKEHSTGRLLREKLIRQWNIPQI